MTAATAALVLSLMGQATHTLYAEQARCAGVTHPKPLPAIRVVPREKFWCGQASPNGWCAGLHTRRSITVTQDGAALSHELFHHVLCQLGDCDPRHKSPLWGECMIPAATASETDETSQGLR
jgi:hypothetical protein